MTRETIHPAETTINDLIEIASRKERKERNFPLVEGIGPQGVGKSTLAGLLARGLKGEHVEENFRGLEAQLGKLNELKRKILLGEETPGVEKATKAERGDASSLALELEIEFLNRKLNQKPRVERALETGLVFWDASVWTDLIYAMTYRQLKIMTEKDCQSYLIKFQETLPQLPAPDLILGLRVSGKVLAARAENRWKEDKGRLFERTVPNEFYWAMAENSQRLMDALSENDLPMKIIDTDSFDFRPVPTVCEFVTAAAANELYDLEGFQFRID